MQASDATLRHIMYFKNSGAKAGASLLHPHSQILGLPIVPNEVARRQRWAREWFLRFGRNVFQHTIDLTLRERDAWRDEGQDAPRAGSREVNAAHCGVVDMAEAKAKAKEEGKVPAGSASTRPTC